MIRRSRFNLGVYVLTHTQTTQETKIVNDIKKAAKDGQMNVVKIMAKDLVRTKTQVTHTHHTHHHTHHTHRTHRTHHTRFTLF
jgi:hypothetical protein